MPDDAQPRFTFAETLNGVMVALLVTMTAVFLLQVLVPPFNEFAMAYLALDTGAFLGRLHLWQAVTSVFLHGGVQHFIGNMVFLWFFGSALANGWRTREFIGYFLLCGVVGSLCFYAVNVFRAGSIKGLGASGAVFGLMVAYAMVYGERLILAFFMIPMRAKFFVAICFGIELILLWTGAQDGVSHIAHVGGAVGGAVYLKVVWRRQDAAGGSRPPPGAGRIASLEIMDDDG